MLAENASVVESWRVTHIASASTFEINRKITRSTFLLQQYNIRQRTGTDPPAKPPVAGWNDVLRLAAEWARSVKKYIATPDRWAELRLQREFLNERSLEELDNTAFTSAEQAALSAQLREIKTYLKENLSLTSDQFARVEASIDEAEAASRRLGRKDWLLLFLGTTVQLYVTDIVPPTAVQHITAVVLQGIGHMFGIGISPPPLAG
jgi:hypothetical protein